MLSKLTASALLVSSVKGKFWQIVDISITTMSSHLHVKFLVLSERKFCACELFLPFFPPTNAEPFNPQYAPSSGRFLVASEFQVSKRIAVQLNGISARTDLLPGMRLLVGYYCQPITTSKRPLPKILAPVLSALSSRRHYQFFYVAYISKCSCTLCAPLLFQVRWFMSMTLQLNKGKVFLLHPNIERETSCAA